IHDTSRDLVHQLVWKVCKTSRHKVYSFNRTQCDYPCITTAITDDTYRFHRLEYCKCLCSFVIPTTCTKFLHEDVICKTQDVSIFFFHFAKDTHAQTWTWEWMTIQHLKRKT